jgi:hypothetical protein
MNTTTTIALLAALAIWLWLGAPLPKLRIPTPPPQPQPPPLLAAWLALRQAAEDPELLKRLDELLHLVIRKPDQK